MDIYNYAESIDYMADYYDMHTGYIYGIQEYGRAKKFGLPTPAEIQFGSDGIIVYENSRPIGIAKKKVED